MSKEKRKSVDRPRTGTRPRFREEAGIRRTRPVSLPYGAASAVLRGESLLAVEWEKSPGDLEEVLAERYPEARVIDPGECAAGRLLIAYAGGKPVLPDEVAGIPVEWDRVRGFHRSVLMELAGIPYGSTITYGELAARAGRKGAARAVGAAVSRNPWPVVIPCHRVVGAGAKMVGFGKGIGVKKILLAFEGDAGRGAPDCTRKRQNV